jgi:hypothetical protein
MNRVTGVIYGGIGLVILAFALTAFVKTIWPLLVILIVFYGIYSLLFQRRL